MKNPAKRKPVECHIFGDIPTQQARDDLRVLAGLPESAKVYCYRKETHRSDVYVVELSGMIDDADRRMSTPEKSLRQEVKFIKKLLRP